MHKTRIIALNWLLVLILMNSAPAQAQREVLLCPTSYRMPATAHQTSSSTNNASPLPLPFFDDFASMQPTPNPKLWINEGVATNLKYAISPITIGTATFDAINNQGELYKHLGTYPEIADRLTSQPINLDLPAADSIYLSFSFQAQGLGYQPNTGDSLALEFRDSSGNWHRAWAASVDFKQNTLEQHFHLNATHSKITADTLNNKFFMTMLPITDPKFLTANFQFRFLNYASIAANHDIPGRLGNSDHWMLDLVHLDSKRWAGDTIYDDVTFSKPIGLLMNNYIQIPWLHFQNAYNEEFNDPKGFTITYKNLGNKTWNVTRRFTIIDHSGMNENVNMNGGAENIFGGQEIEYTRNFDYRFTSSWSDSAKFTLKSYLITDNDPQTQHLRHNDTVWQDLNLLNYYAYDDGSAESGYGIYGEGSANAAVAYKFHNYQPDTLLGMMIYFNRTANNANQAGFKLTVWADNNGQPGQIITQIVRQHTQFGDSLNRFSIYPIPPTFIAEGTFYIGWEAVSDCMLNIGFDRNHDNHDKIFVNLGSGWQNTKFNGSLMMRPIMGQMGNLNGDRCQNIENQQITVYPNPASTFIRINTSQGQTPVALQIINTMGQVMLQGNWAQQIDVRSLKNGMYILRILLPKGKVYTHKLLIHR